MRFISLLVQEFEIAQGNKKGIRYQVIIQNRYTGKYICGTKIDPDLLKVLFKGFELAKAHNEKFENARAKQKSSGPYFKPLFED